jgi:ABC-2 type transport system permease protein
MNLRALRVTAVVAARQSWADRGGLVFTGFLYLAVIAALGSLWRGAAEANGGDVAGYSAVALVWYIATSEAATISLNARLIEQLGDDVSSGGVAVELLRPVSLVGLRVAAELGRSIPRLGVCVLVAAVLVPLTAGAPPSLAALALALPALLLAITCNIVAMHTFAASAFWLRETRSTWFLYQKLVFVLGGMLLPLEVLPDAMERVAWMLPFATMAYVPARIASGHVEPQLLLLQLGWLVALGALAMRVFSSGEQRLQVVGG